MADCLGVRIPLEGDQRPKVKQVKAMIHGRWIFVSEVFFTFKGHPYRSYYSDWGECQRMADLAADAIAEKIMNERIKNAVIFVDGAPL